ncbi:MAG: aspartate/glutamate racemase family protein [Armatimonadota bacterium]|nr:aspartate/glutamate racemase family protein [Armatimonadota bacterium]
MPAVLHVIPVRARPGRVERTRAYLASLVPGVEACVIDLPQGPADLEHFVDDHAAVGEMLKVLPRWVAQHPVGAVSIGCFYDPGLWELREALEVPVVGIGEASLVAAGAVASRVAVLVGDWKWVPKMAQNAYLAGVAHRICAWRSVGRAVQAMHDDPEATYHALWEEGRVARDDHHAEAIVLACAALSGTAERLGEALGMPVIDPVAAGFALASALAMMRLKTSKLVGYRPKP